MSTPDTVTTYEGEVLPEHNCVKLTHGVFAGEFAPLCQAVYLHESYGEPALALRRACTYCAHTRFIRNGTHWFLDEDTTEARIDGRWHITANIFLDDLYTCDLCGDRTSDSEEYRANGEIVCESCWAAYHDDVDDDDDSSSLLSYNDRTADTLPREEPDADLIIGIEVEVEAHGRRESALEELEGIFPSRYCVYKRDGSLDDDRGIEIVTRPDAPGVHRRIWENALSGADGDAFRGAVRGWHGDSCGMHVHVSRAHITQGQLGRIVLFMNAIRNRKMIRDIAGRNPEEWAAFKDKKLSDMDDCGHFYGEDRYESVNTTGSKTIEFRIFRSNLALAGFLKNLEFVESVVRYCSDANSGEVEDTHGYLEYLRGKDYPNLKTFLTKRKYAEYVTAHDGQDCSSGEGAPEFVDTTDDFMEWGNMAQARLSVIVSEYTAALAHGHLSRYERDYLTESQEVYLSAERIGVALDFDFSSAVEKSLADRARNARESFLTNISVAANGKFDMYTRKVYTDAAKSDVAVLLRLNRNDQEALAWAEDIKKMETELNTPPVTEVSR